MISLQSFGVSLFWLAVLILLAAVVETGRALRRKRAERITKAVLARAAEAAMRERVMTPAQRKEASQIWKPEELDGFLKSLENGFGEIGHGER